MGGANPVKIIAPLFGGGAKPAAPAPQVDAPKPQPLSSPTQAEVEQGETSRLLKAKRKGRSSTVLSSSSGVTDEASVSKKTLLGS
jgi:hypothetical protein